MFSRGPVALSFTHSPEDSHYVGSFLVVVSFFGAIYLPVFLAVYLGWFFAPFTLLRFFVSFLCVSGGVCVVSCVVTPLRVYRRD